MFIVYSIVSVWIRWDVGVKVLFRGDGDLDRSSVQPSLSVFILVDLFVLFGLVALVKMSIEDFGWGKNWAVGMVSI